MSEAVAHARLPERTLKRRFQAATGSPLIEYLQNLRIEEAKRLLEMGALPVEEISAEVGYADVSFFRRLFKRLTGLRPNEYRRMFGAGDRGSGGAAAAAPGQSLQAMPRGVRPRDRAWASRFRASNRRRRSGRHR